MIHIQEKYKKKLHKLTNRVGAAIMAIEVFLAMLIIIAVLISGVALVISVVQQGSLTHLLDYDNFQSLLSYLLMLIIGLELALMLIKHKPSNVIDVMIYAIARKMLIYSTATIEMLVGVIALGILFIIKVSLKKAKVEEDQDIANN
ncbi:phosphate-starvation-inducible PsiE family protein [Amphibacillus jilinensis]|uniref:phosphate-starvation-inducible PsiE family protein n=1 Tax=Amphibacillus jilinensis TaxID=1216008 RepID=UPI0002FE3588|nr:phosphate-starvation-inducible PsiE family protein [Amphibacillus jilinensis]